LTNFLFFVILKKEFIMIKPKMPPSTFNRQVVRRYGSEELEIDRMLSESFHFIDRFGNELPKSNQEVILKDISKCLPLTCVMRESKYLKGIEEVRYRASHIQRWQLRSLRKRFKLSRSQLAVLFDVKPEKIGSWLSPKKKDEDYIPILRKKFEEVGYELEFEEKLASGIIGIERTGL